MIKTLGEIPLACLKIEFPDPDNILIDTDWKHHSHWKIKTDLMRGAKFYGIL